MINDWKYISATLNGRMSAAFNAEIGAFGPTFVTSNVATVALVTAEPKVIKKIAEAHVRFRPLYDDGTLCFRWTSQPSY